MALILNIDTATKNCSVCLAENGKPLAVKEELEGFNHAALLSTFIMDVFEKAGKQLKDLSAVAVSEGPGSYTGLRIGTSVGKGICYGNDIPLIGIGTLKSLAHQATFIFSDARQIVTVMDSRKEEVYIAVYSQDLREIVAPKPINVKNIDNINIEPKDAVVVGTGLEKIKSTRLSTSVKWNKTLYYSAVNISMLSFIKYGNEAYKNLIYFEPLYLKSVYVTQSKPLLING